MMPFNDKLPRYMRQELALLERVVQRRAAAAGNPSRPSAAKASLYVPTGHSRH